MGEFFQAAIKAVAVLVTAVINFAQAPVEDSLTHRGAKPALVAHSQPAPEPVSAMVESVRKLADATMKDPSVSTSAVARAEQGYREVAHRRVIVIVPEVIEAPSAVVGEDIVESEVRGKVIAIIAEELPAETHEELMSLLEPMG